MATVKSDVFKFVSLRPPVSIEKENQELNFMVDSRNVQETRVGQLKESFNPEDGSKIEEQLKDFIKRNKFTTDFPTDATGDVLRKVYAIAKNEKDVSTLKTAIENILDEPVSEFLGEPSTIKLLGEIWDRYYAFFLLNRFQPQNLETLLQHLRTFHFLEKLSSDTIKNVKTLQKILTAKPVVPTQLTELPKPIARSTAPKEDKPSEETTLAYKKIWNDFLNTQRAINEVKGIKFENKVSTATSDVLTPNPQLGKEVKSRLTVLKNELVVNRQSFDRLHAGTKTLLSDLQVSVDNLQLPEVLTQLDNKLEQIGLTVSGISDPYFFSLTPPEIKLTPGGPSFLTKFSKDAAVVEGPRLFLEPTNIRKLIKPLGIGDLKVVKQKLKKYVAGEVAHIENVLKGESKDRKHRVLDRTEDIFTVSNETNEETIKDTQTTERFELKKESDKTVQEQMSIQAGVTVSGSYGTVTFGAHGDFAYSTSTQEATKNSSNFAREVIDKSVSKIQKKTSEERTTKKLHEVEEINQHGLNNVAGTEHIAGIYRWVDKYYEAQIYNYGKRMMFEFIIPEPAAFYKFAQNNKPKKNIVPPKPLALKPEQIDEKNYRSYIQDYNVQGIKPPPLPFKTVSISLIKDGMPLDGNAHVNSTKELIIPTGYFAQKGVWFDCSAYYSNWPHLEVIIGNQFFRLIRDEHSAKSIEPRIGFESVPFHFMMEGTSIQISVNSYDIISYALNAYVFVERTMESYQQWQIEVYEKIMNAYKVLLDEYNQNIAAQEVQAGIAIHGQNPRINREIEEVELKKHCVKMLMDNYLYGSFDSMKNLPGTGPEFDIFDAFNEGKIVQYFEQAFEWENITYLFYPYFWAKKDKWISHSTTYDTDPLFTQFLQAGSARVVIPVHPAFNDSILLYLTTGVIWNGGDTPGIKDPLFISIVEELKDQTDDLANAVPEGDPWEVILPTTLVYLQKEDTLPTFD